MNRVAVSGYDYQHLEFTVFLDLLQRWKIKFIELWPGNVSELPVEKIQKELDDRQIAVACVNAGVAYFPNKDGEGEKAQELILKAINLATSLNARFVNTYMGGNPARDMMTTIQLYQRTMDPCINQADKLGVTLLLENHFDNRNEDPEGQDVARRPETLRYLFEFIGSPFFKLTYDPCNFFIAGEEAFPYAYQLLREYISHVHVKSATRYSEFLHGPENQFKLLPDSINGRYLPVSLYDGAVNFESILDVLNSDRFSGYLVVEPHTEIARVELVGHENVRYVRDHLNAANQAQSGQ